MTKADETQVLIITQFFPPESMGGAHRWEKIGQHLGESIEPHVLCTFPTFPFGEFERKWRPVDSETVSGIPVTRLFTYQPLEDTVIGRILNYVIFSILSSLYVLMTFRRYDCIITMSAPHTTFIPGLVGKFTGRNWVIDIFDLWIDNAADLGYIDDDSVSFRLISQLEQTSFAMADSVFVITETMKDHYEDKYPDVTFEAYVVPFGVDMETFSPDIKPAAKTDVIYTGNLGTGQALVPFLKGFAALDRDTNLTIVGHGERRAELETLVRNLDIENRVSFEGYVPREDIPNLLAGAKVSLVPLKTSYQLDYARPTKLLETMAVGTPYVASAVGEISRLSEERGTGTVCDNEKNEVNAALRQLLLDKDLRTEMGMSGIEYISEDHDWPKIGSQVSRAIHKAT